MTWYLIGLAIAFALVLRRVFRPRITVAQVNGVWLATVTSVWSRREYARTSTDDWRTQRDDFPIVTRVHWWHAVSDGDPLSVRDSRRADSLVTVHGCMKPVRDYAGAA